MRAEQFADEVVRQGQVPELVAEVLRGKALAGIVENATVTDASGRPVELKRLQPDGSLAEESTDELPESQEDAAAEPAEQPS